MISQKYKKSILMDAIKGNITTQNESDENTNDIIESIREIKNKSKSNFRAKHEHDIHIKDDDLLFEIPDNWEWTVLGELSTLITDGTHKTPNYVDNGIPFLSVQNISGGSFDLSKLKYITKIEHNSINNRCNPQRGDILLCRIGTLGKPIIVDLDFPFSIFVSLALIKLANCEIVKYVEMVLSSPLMDSWMTKYKVGGGTHTNKLNLRDIYYIPIPLPPLAEQKRIVEKLEELLPLIDSLEKDELKLNDLMQKFPESMTSALLLHAMEGNLVEQYTEDEKAINESTRILKVTDLISENIEYSFKYPDNWEIIELDKVSNLSTGNSINETVKKKKYSKKINGYSYIGTKDVNYDHSINYDNGVYIPTEDNFRVAKSGSTLLCIEGGSAGRKVGLLDRDVCYGNKLVSIMSDLLEPRFLFYYVKSPVFQYQFKENMTGMIGGVGINKIKKIIIPIPPMSEQKRIVNKLDELLPIVSQLNNV